MILTPRWLQFASTSTIGENKMARRITEAVIGGLLVLIIYGYLHRCYVRWQTSMPTTRVEASQSIPEIKVQKNHIDATSISAERTMKSERTSHAPLLDMVKDPAVLVSSVHFSMPDGLQQHAT